MFSMKLVIATKFNPNIDNNYSNFIENLLFDCII